MLKRTYNLIGLLLLFVVLIFAANGCDKGIVVDTEGLPPEQVEFINWKVKYAVALDWYDWQIKSYKAQLDAMPLADAQATHKELKPFWDAVDTALKSFKSAVYAQSADQAERDAAYQEYLAAKAKILQMLITLFD